MANGPMPVLLEQLQADFHRHVAIVEHLQQHAHALGPRQPGIEQGLVALEGALAHDDTVAMLKTIRQQRAASPNLPHPRECKQGCAGAGELGRECRQGCAGAGVNS